MRAATRFSALLVIGLTLSLSIKTFVSASVLRPDENTTAIAAEKPLEQQGFQIAGLSTFSGKVALMAGKDSCFVYLVPVSEQGWHQETIRKGLLNDQSLSFLFENAIYENNQPRWRPLFEFYWSFALAHAGLDRGYSPVYAIVSSSECKMQSLDWSAFERVPYRREVLF